MHMSQVQSDGTPQEKLPKKVNSSNSNIKVAQSIIAQQQG